MNNLSGAYFLTLKLRNQISNAESLLRKRCGQKHGKARCFKNER